MGKTTNEHVQDPRIGSTLSVITWLIDGDVDSVKVFTATRFSIQYIENLMRESGDHEDNWTKALYGDGDFTFDHKKLNEQIVITHTMICSPPE